MALTGIPLILLMATATGAAGVATGWVWRRGGRLRPAVRTVAVLLVEVLTVLTAALGVNRHEQFYPSWQALRGDTGTIAIAERRPAGRLDDRVHAGPLIWRPPALAAWHLAGPPTVWLPHDYRERPGDAFPVVLDLTGPGDRDAGPGDRDAGPGDRGAGSRRTPDAVTVTIAPTATTTASALRDLPAALGHDLRVTTTAGWDVVGDEPLAAAFVAAAPAGLAVLDQPVTALPPALAAPLRLPSRVVAS
ncbi:hypothetical protein [Paractinoplanes maris]|uniref:hypothetical protein n=1 Tax=Paractinoplanes maris TaxID=1734446 RepID=UPI002020126B|nr:hypothetical protein [Actinoplanes maris]